jgi:hypothetical protein
VELIVAALAAGAGAGVTDTVSGAIKDAYAGFKGLLARRLGGADPAGHDQVRQALDGQETEPGVWQARLGDDLTASGADGDEEILAAARQLLGLLDPAGDTAGAYQVSVATNYGVAGTFQAPVTINYGQLPVPPAAPGAA